MLAVELNLGLHLTAKKDGTSEENAFVASRIMGVTNYYRDKRRALNLGATHHNRMR